MVGENVGSGRNYRLEMFAKAPADGYPNDRRGGTRSTRACHEASLDTMRDFERVSLIRAHEFAGRAQLGAGNSVQE